MPKQPFSKNVLFETTSQEPTAILITDYLRQYGGFSGRSLRQYFFKGLVHLNHRKAHSQAVVKPGDTIQVFQPKTETQVLKPESGKLDIVYEDEGLLILNKPARIAVHPSGSIQNGTLSNQVAAYFQQKNLPIKVRPVNRLDYGTSGLIIFAKNQKAQQKAAEAIQNHNIARIYYAVVQGIPTDMSGALTLAIGEVNGKRCVIDSGQMAHTDYKVIRNGNDAAFLEIELQTGRTHQIRIHLSHIGHPIIGDKEYGKTSPLINRVALHAGKLIFHSPDFKLSELTAPFPEDFLQLLNQLMELN